MYRAGWPCISFDWQNLRSFIRYGFLSIAGNYDSSDKYFISCPLHFIILALLAH